ncbi:MAG TPA: HAD family hydrolase [Iamia sp.]|nr:HAD family hydrolase [Iamia sp.]
MAVPARPAPTADAGGWSAAAARLAPEAVPGPRVGTELDAVLFDAGGVIVVPDPFSTGPALAPYGATAEIATLIRAHYVGMRAHATSPADDEGIWLDYVRAHIAETGVPDDRAEEALGAFVRVFGHRTWRFPLLETITAMERLRDRGTPLGVVSNAVGQVEDVLRHTSCCQVGPGGGVEVDVVVDSAVIGIEKPDPRVFAPAVEVMAGFGVEPDRIGYVGDSLRYDVAGARAAGLVPLLLDPYDLHADVDLGEGAHRIRSVHDLLPAPDRPEATPADAVDPEGG